MRAGEKLGWGIGIMCTGGLLLIGGVTLSATLIGACIGVPMFLAGLPLAIWGSIWTYQGNASRQAEIIARGIRDGLEHARRSVGAVESRAPHVLPQAPEGEDSASPDAAGRI